jgi:hypothetical protein
VRSRRARIAIGAVFGLLALLVLAHTPPGLRAIGWVTGSDGCPFGGTGDELTASAAEQLRVAQLAREPGGEIAAPSRPALGFALDRDRRGDVLAWAARHGVACRADRSGAGLRCIDVPGSALPAPLAITGIVAFGFDATDRLVSVQHQSASATPLELARTTARTALAKLANLGSVTTRGDSLEAARFVHQRASVRFADYRADVLASNVGVRWTVVQTYQTIPRG